MPAWWTRCVAFCVLSLAASLAPAATPTQPQMSQRIDTLLAQRWERDNAQPAPAASDAEFLRRAALDLTGVIPNVSQVRAFLADTRPDKRARLIDRLLQHPRHAAHLANVWREALIPSDPNVNRFSGYAGFEAWLRGRFADNAPYDEIATQLLLANGAATQPGPALFYTAVELKPEELAGSASRILLGVQIQCAQCHDHPFDHWTRRDFWGFAAFFARLERPQAPQRQVARVADARTGEVKLPGSDEVVAPRFLNGAVSADGGLNRRVRLATWLTARENPFFARAAVNRVWGQLFGRGLVNPIDDMGKHNPPSHPELLDQLADYFIATRFDLRNLFRTLANTQAYQLSSASAEGEAEADSALFARMAIKSFTAEQLYDCLAEAMRRRSSQSGAQQRSAFGRGFDANRQTFLAKFQAPTQGATEYQSGIPQALTLMNGAYVGEATDLARSDLLIALEAPFFSDEQRVETLFLSTLSRLPSEEERAIFVARVRGSRHSPSAADGSDSDRRQALGDVLWALLNSAEFTLNH